MTRFSQGGEAVVKSLEKVGLELSDIPRDVTLSESTPRRHPASVVLLQNAWCIAPWGEISPLLKEYPPKRRVREVLRRGVARRVALRARKRLTLTQYMKSLSERSGLGATTAIRVGTGIDLFSESPEPVPDLQGRTFALVPGSLQAYKNPHGALTFAERWRRQLKLDTVVFAGLASEESNPFVNELTTRAVGSGLHAEFVNLSRSETLWAMQAARITILASRLESLSFALGEALYFSPLVAASSIPAHLEVAETLGAKPIALNAPDLDYRPANMSIETLETSWAHLAHELNNA